MTRRIARPPAPSAPGPEPEGDYGASGVVPATGSPRPAEPEAGADTPVGKTIGRYDVRLELASGGMATVYLARLRGAAGFQKVVALKSIHPHLSRDPRFVEMFLDEARIASQMSHVNVCQVFDFGEADGSYYLAMEYLVGEPLGRVLTAAVGRGEHDTLEYRALIARIASDVCDGLHAVHEVRDDDGVALDVVHRDVSPGNVFVTFDGAAKLVDFGIASARDRLHRTETGEVKGNLAYAAPEQIRGERVDRRADVWSMGVVLWEALAGERLFRRATSVETMYAVLNEAVPRLEARRPELPGRLAAVVHRALDRDPGGRHATARALGQELQDVTRDLGAWPTRAEVSQWMQLLFPGGESRHAARVRRATEVAAPPARSPAAAVPRPGPGPWRAVAIGGLATTALMGGAVVYLLGREPAPVPPAPRPPAPAVQVEPEALTPTPPPAAVEPAARSVSAPEVDPAPSPPRPRVDRRPDRPAAAGVGQVTIVTPDGWASVHLGGRALGQTPLRTTLPAGEHVLELRPFGRPPARRVRVRVDPDRPSRVSARVTD